MIITRPLLAYKVESVVGKPIPKEILSVLPALCTPKIDGIRCLKINGKVLSRSFKPIANKYTRELIESTCPDGFDGELVPVDGDFNSAQSAFMTISGKPNFIYYVFDFINNEFSGSQYHERIEILKQVYSPPFVTKLIPEFITTEKELLNYEVVMLSSGFEGVMLRKSCSFYKCGRSTLNEKYLVALKRFSDGEGVVVGFEPQWGNNNEQELSELGLYKRSSKQSGMYKKDTLGAIIVKDLLCGTIFKIGTGKGLTETIREQIWIHRNDFFGKIAHYRYQKHGMKDKPRIPTFVGFRNKQDMS